MISDDPTFEETVAAAVAKTEPDETREEIQAEDPPSCDVPESVFAGINAAADPDAIVKRIEERARCYFAESLGRKNLPEQTRRDMAYQASCIFEVHHRISLEKLAGVAKAEEARTITSLTGAWRRAMSDLGCNTGELIDQDLEDL